MGDAAMTRDFDAWHYTNVNLNYSLGSKSVEPLWWLNPLDFAYNELNAPRHMKMPKPVLDDADGDGVTDQFDNEPNTPAGCPVDAARMRPGCLRSASASACLSCRPDTSLGLDSG